MDYYRIDQKIVKIAFVIIISLSLFGCNPGSKTNAADQMTEEEAKVRQLHADYVDGWKNMNEQKVIGLLEDDAQIQPNRLTPITGKENIREFWFPNDSSNTTINEFTTEIISFRLIDSIAIVTHSSVLDWDYKKDTTYLGMHQKGFNTTIYRKQTNESWKIWRSMWTDLYVKNK